MSLTERVSGDGFKLTPSQLAFHAQHKARMEKLHRRATPSRPAPTFEIPNEPFHPTRPKFAQAAFERTVDNAVEQMREAAQITEVPAYNSISDGMRLATEALDREAARVNSVMEIHSVAKIQTIVCRYYRITRAQMLGKSRLAKLVRPRHIAMYLCCTYTQRSLPDIARRFGGRDHTTALNARERITEALFTEPGLQNTVDVLAALIEAVTPEPAGEPRKRRAKQPAEAT